MLTHQRLFYALGLENHIHIYISVSVLKNFFLVNGLIEHESILNRSVCPMYGALEAATTTTLAQSTPGSNGNERVLHTFQNRSLIIRCSLGSYSGPLFFFSAGDTVRIF